MANPMSVSEPDKRRKYDDAFKTEALRLARESRSTRAAARQLGISENAVKYRAPERPAWVRVQAAAAPAGRRDAHDLAALQ